MTHINIDKAAVIDMYSDDIKKVLRELMMAELDKDENEINTDFVDECVNALLEIEKEDNGFTALVPLLTNKQFLSRITGSNLSGWKNLNRFTRVAVAAAILAGTTFTANAAVEAVTGVNLIAEVGESVQNSLRSMGIIKGHGIDVVDGEDDEDEETTAKTTTTEKLTEKTTVVTTTAAPAETTTAVTTTHHIEVADGEDDDETTTKKKTTTTKRHGIEVVDGEDEEEETTKPTTAEPSTVKPPEPTTIPSVIGDDEKPTNPNEPDKPQEIYLTGISAEYNGFKTHYIYGEELSYDGLKLQAVYSDGTSRELSLDDCTYTKRVDMTKTADYTLTVYYQGCNLEIQITVRPDENTRGAGVYSNDDYDYLLTDEGAYITKYKGSAQRLNLDEVDGNKVISICEGVFSGTNIEMITAQNVRIIYDNAFKDCDNLIDCFVPDAVEIGDSAFENCTALKSAVFSYQLENIGAKAYKNTAIEKVTLPSGITVIPEKLFEDCKKLTEVTFEGSVTQIEKDAFNSCEALEWVYGTENIISVGEKAFFDDKNVNFASQPAQLENVGAYAFSNCNSLDFGPLNNLESIDIGSFEYCRLLKEVTLPSAIKNIPNYAFIGTGLEKLDIPEGVETIGEYALSATMIKEIHLPKSLGYIGNMGLYITRLRDVYFECRHVEISDNAFYSSTRLTFHVYNYSTAMKYAVDNDINYELLDRYNIPNVDGEDD